MMKGNAGEKIQERLFLSDSYLQKAEARILRKQGNKVIPDKTILFSFSGGQESDSGWIGGISVSGSGLAELKGEKAIEYELEREPDFKEGDSVTIELDWEKRKKLMRLHSAAHVVSYVFQDVSGNDETIGSNVSSSKARLDYSCDHNISGPLAETEQKANAFINEGHEISIWQEEKGEGAEQIFHWKCGEWDMPCSGLHVKNTREIGRIRLKRANIGKGKERIEILLAD